MFIPYLSYSTYICSSNNYIYRHQTFHSFYLKEVAQKRPWLDKYEFLTAKQSQCATAIFIIPQTGSVLAQQENYLIEPQRKGLPFCETSIRCFFITGTVLYNQFQRKLMVMYIISK